MKTKIKSVSRRALAIVLCFLMMFSTLMVGTISTANAVNHTGGYVYFLKPSTWTSTYIMMFIGHDSYTSVYNMSKVSNTDNLYRYTMVSWSNATYVAFANASSSWGSGSWGPSNRTNATHYTNVYNNYGFNSGSYYVCVPASTSNNCNLTINYKSSASALNLTTRANVYGSDDGTTYSSNAAAGTVSVSGYYMSSYSTASTRSAVSSTSSTAYASTTLAPGSTATFTATPADGYEFVGWSTSSSESGIVSTDTTYKYSYGISYSAKTVYALFKAANKTVTISAGDNGSVDPSGEQTISGSGLVVTPTPDEDYAFAGWELSDGVTATDNGDGTYTITATADGTATATFVKDTFTATISAGDGGSVSPSGSQKVGPSGLSVTATPDEGYVFDGWVVSGDGVSVSDANSATTTITATADGGSVTANFKPYYTASLTVNDDSMGSADLSAAAQLFPGDTYTVTIEPNEGFHLASITVNSEDVTSQVANGAYTGTVDSENIEIEVNFAEDEAGMFNITNNYNAEFGSVKIYSENMGDYISTSIEENDLFTLEIEPKDGYEIVSVEVLQDGFELGDFEIDPEIYMYEALGNITINVTFAEITYEVWFESAGNGSVSEVNAIQVGAVNGYSGEVTVTPDANYIFDKWTTTDGIIFTYNEDGTYTVTATQGGTITANFVKDGVYLNLGTVGDGIELTAFNNTTGLAVENGGWVELGDEIVVTANILGDGEYALAGWTCSYADTDEVELTYTFVVTADYRDENKGISVSASTKLTYLPTWVEQPSGGYGYLYFHTIGDDLKSSEAWTVVEQALTTTNGTIAVGSYSSSSSYRVVLPPSAVNSDGTYTVYNARQASTITLVDSDGNKYTVASGETAKVPTNLTGMILGGSSTTCALSVYTTTAEDTVYINTNEKSSYSGTDEATYTSKYSDTDVANVAELLTALSLDGTYDHKDKAEVKKATFTVVDADSGEVYVSEQSKKIKGRGNTTWNGTQKKSWNINLDNKRSIDGMANNKKWSLLANYQDPSLSRNRFLYDLADSVGVRYATDSRIVELYANGLYVGSYQLTEKYDNIEDNSDVEDDLITNVEYDEAGEEIVSCDVNTDIFATDDISFMIELAGGTQGDEIEWTPGNNSGILNLSLPDPGDVQDFDDAYGLNLQELLVEYIQTRYDNLYELITDPTTTYEELSAVADVDSLAKTYLIQELGKNYDSGVSSFYLCYEGGKFYAAPVWDFDNSLGNPNDTNSRKTADWWCETWLGYSDSYTGNFVNAMSKNTYVMMAARKAWFGTSADDTTSFLYNLNQFDTADASSADISGADSGLQPRAYYESIIAGSQACNSLKWSVAPNEWCQGHTSLAIYSLGTDYASIGDVLNTVDYDTYYLPEVTVSSATQSYTQGLAASTSSAKDEFDYAADYMMSRANWLTAQFADTGSYYFVNSTIGWGVAANDYPFEEVEPGIYKTKTAMTADSTLNHSFKIVNSIASTYVGSVTETDLQFGYDEESNTYVTNNAFACAIASGALKTTSGETPWDMVNVYYQPAENKVWVDGYELYDVVVDAPTDYVDVTVTNNATGEAQTLDYTTGDEYTVTVAIKADYADMFTLESVTLDGEDVTLTDGAFTGTIGDADSTVKVNLLENTYNVTITYDNTLGSIQDSDGNDVASGSTIAIGAMIGEELTITPIDAYECDLTSSDTVEVTDNGDGTYSVKATADGVIEVSFHKYQLPVVFNAGAGVTVTAVDANGNEIASGDLVEADTVITVSYALADGVTFAGWTATATDEDEDESTFTFTVNKTNAVDGTITVTAESTISAVETSYFEEYLYFHTIGDDCANTEAWALMECTQTQNAIDGVIKPGVYIGNYDYQYNVFLPENALNSDGTYTVYNNYSTDMTFVDADGTLYKVDIGEIAKIPSTVEYVRKSTYANCTLNIYTSAAEDSVYINTNESSTYSGTDETTYTSKYGDTNVANISELTTALSLDGTYNHKDKAEVKKATFSVIGDDGTVYVSEQSKKIKGRGNTTWNGTLKKSWNVNLDNKVSIDGMAKNKKWSLLANYQDPSLSRNRFLYDLADSVGVKYATDSRYVDVYINGLYVGAYQLTEKYDNIEDVQDAEYLLDITEETTTNEETGEVTTTTSATVKTDLVDGTGDYSFMIELACESQSDEIEWTPGNGSGILNLSLPDPGDVQDLDSDYGLDGALQSAITSYISTKYDELYTLLTDAETTYEELSAIADVESLAKTYLIQELGKNYDSGISSFYLTYEPDEDGVYRFFAAPVWDFDNSIGNPDQNSEWIAKDYITDDYSEPSGWWCKYWLNSTNKYTGNFVYAMANSDLIMEVAKKAWYGTGIDDTSSFIYNINSIFDSTSTANTIDKKNSGIQSRAYYESVIASSAAMSAHKWSVVGNVGWTGEHSNNKMYQIDYEALYNDIDMSTYNLPYWYAETQSYTTNYYTVGTFTSNENSGGEFDYAADWLISRCAWISYHLAAPEAYYLVGGTDGIYIWSKDSRELMLTEVEIGSGIYVAKSVPIENIYTAGTSGGTGTYFKITDTETYLGPDGGVDIALTTATAEEDMYKSRPTAFTTNVINQTVDNGAYYISDDNYTALGGEDCTAVNIYFDPAEMKVWVTAAVEDVYTAPTVSIESNAADNKVEDGNTVTLTATATGITAALDGDEEFKDYVGTITYDFYMMTGEYADPTTDIPVGSVRTSSETASITFQPSATATYYVVAYPTSDSSASGVATILIYYGKVAKEFEAVVYFDFNGATVPDGVTPELVTIDDTNTETSYELTELGDSNIYTSNVTVDYYESVTGKLFSNFGIHQLVLGDIVVGITNDCQAEIDKFIDSKTLWLKSTDDTLESNMINVSFTYDDTLTYTDTVDAVKTTANVDDSVYTTKRVYFTNNYSWSNVSVLYWNTSGSVGSTWPGKAMSWYGTNAQSQALYYADIPVGAQYVIFNNGNNGSQTVNITLPTNMSATDNNAYYISGGSGTSHTVGTWSETTPVITSYYSNVVIAKGQTTSIKPVSNVDTIHYGSSTNTTLSYSGTYFSVATDGTLTAKAVGTQTINIEPRLYYGSNWLPGITTYPVTVTVVDTDALNTALANAEVIIADQEANDTYTTLTYNTLLEAYNAGVNVLENLTTQTAIDDATAAITNAIDNMRTNPTTKAFDLISYHTAVANVTVNNAEWGTVTEPDFGYVQTITPDTLYTVTYAAADGTADFKYDLNSTGIPTNADLYECTSWTMGEGVVSDNAELNVTTAPESNCTFTANFIMTGYRAVKLTYKFQDYDTSDGNYVYDESKETLDASYSTQAIIAEELVTDSDDNRAYLETVITDTDGDDSTMFVPSIKSNYFDYSVDMDKLNTEYVVDEATGEITEVIIELQNTAHIYTVTINGTAVQCYYQEILYVESSDFGVSGEAVWYDQNNEDVILAVGDSYEFHVVIDNMLLGCKANDDGTTMDGKAVVTNSYYELSYNSSGTQKLTQNFYIVDYYTGVAYDDDGNVIAGATNVQFVGGGVVYYSMSNATASAYLTGADVAKEFIIDKITAKSDDYSTSINVTTDSTTKVGYRYLTLADGGDIYRYSDTLDAYQYIFNLTFTNTSSNANKEVALYSYYVYSYELNGETQYQVSVSDTYAVASMYEAS